MIHWKLLSAAVIVSGCTVGGIAAAGAGTPQPTAPAPTHSASHSPLTEDRTSTATRIADEPLHHHRQRGRAPGAPASTALPRTTGRPAAEPGDDRGVREAEPGDDRGVDIEPGDDRGVDIEPGDDRGVRETEAGDDRGVDIEPGDDRGGHRGPGGGSQADG